jgi:hypothetical protein
MKIPDEQPLFTLKTASKILGISTRLMNTYEREGLIISYKNGTSNKKFYSLDDIERVRAIRNLIYINRLSIQGIKTLLALIPCWKFNGCSESARDKCRFRRTHHEPCWTQKTKSPNCRDKDCRHCAVYGLLPECDHMRDYIFD